MHQCSIARMTMGAASRISILVCRIFNNLSTMLLEMFLHMLIRS